MSDVSPAVAFLHDEITRLRGEVERLKNKPCAVCEGNRARFLESIRIKQQCRHCGYQSIKWLGENAACPMRDCNGGMETIPKNYVGDDTSNRETGDA